MEFDKPFLFSIYIIVTNLKVPRNVINISKAFIKYVLYPIVDILYFYPDVELAIIHAFLVII